MKRFIIILGLVLLVFIGWLIFHQPKTTSNVVAPTPSPPGTNVETTPSATAPAPAGDTNAFVRPDSIDEDHWNRLMQVRQLALEQNQPIEFYARVLDQNEQPIEGARLTLKLTRTDEKMFDTTNFFHRQMGDEVLTITLELISDANGWIQVAGTNGSFLSVWGLAKEGYRSSYPDGNFGGVSYEPNGRRNPSGDIQMTNAWNPDKGYTFHLWEKGETERLIQWERGYTIKRDKPEQVISLFPIPEGQVAYPDLVLKTPFVHPEIQEGDRVYDRWIIIEAATDAGIQETSMLYPYAAPQEGYGRNFKFMYQLGNRESEGWTRRFYVKARNEKVFASLTVNFSSASGLTLQINGIINPAGSPNLEPDPEKLITNPEEIRKIDEATRVK